MTDDATTIVSKFYNEVGWKTIDGITNDAQRWEDLRGCACRYISQCRKRVGNHIPSHGDKMLDMASGPIQYQEYQDYSRNFKTRYCVDLSADALKMAQARIGGHGVFLHGDFLKMELEPNTFDCAISLHTIYHIHRDLQADAVRKLLRVTKPGKPVIVVYANPNVPIFIKRVVTLISLPTRAARSLKRLFSSASPETPQTPANIYYFGHPLSWWQQFSDVATIKIYPNRSFQSHQQKLAFPDNIIGRAMFWLLFRMEQAFPRFFANKLHYPMVVLTKSATEHSLSPS
jgi:SAM-dependent methyltransferase